MGITMGIMGIMGITIDWFRDAIIAIGIIAIGIIAIDHHGVEDEKIVIKCSNSHKFKPRLCYITQQFFSKL